MDIADKYSRKPIHCYLGGGDVLPLLLNRGIKLDAYAMAGHGMLDKLKAAIKKNPSLLNSKDAAGRSLLDHAAVKEQVAVARWLLDKGCPVNMYWAARLGYADDLAQLLKRNKYLEKYSFSQVQPVPLFGAIASGVPQIVELILKAGASPNGQRPDINQPMRLAVSSGFDSVAKLLLEYGAHPILNFRVIDQNSSRPIANAEIKIIQNNSATKGSTDTNGYKQIEISNENTDVLKLFCHVDGYVPTEVCWKKQKGIWQIPLDFDMTLKSSITVGGIMKNPDGQPVKNAKVYFQLPYKSDEFGEQYHQIEHRFVKTDKNGKWRCDFLPMDIDGIEIQVMHPDYICDDIFAKGIDFHAKSLRDGSCELVLQRGIDVSGIVMDQNQKPVANARVSKVHETARRFPIIKTDRQGRFMLPPVGAGQIVLNVETNDGLKCVQKVIIRKDMIPLEIYVSPQVTSVN